MPEEFTLKFTAEELVEELRAQARRVVNETNMGMPAAAAAIGIPMLTLEDTLEWEAADMIEKLSPQ